MAITIVASEETTSYSTSHEEIPMQQCRRPRKRHIDCGYCGRVWSQCEHYWASPDHEIAYWRSLGYTPEQGDTGVEQLIDHVGRRVQELIRRLS